MDFRYGKQSDTMEEGRLPALALPAPELPTLALPAPELPALALPAPELPALALAASERNLTDGVCCWQSRCSTLTQL
jgi:hypothetical protein